MLPLLRVSESIKVVSTSDPSVKVSKKEREVPQWIPAEGAKTNADCLFATVRALSSSEVLRAQSVVSRNPATADAELTIQAARLGTVGFTGPGLQATEPEEVRGILERLSPADLAGLGGFILRQSLLPVDPT